MREQDKWRDRVQVSLDNRQLFLLFSAAVVILGLVFALGVVVGKRLVSTVAERPAADPLELLDQLASQEGEAEKNLALADPLSGAGLADAALADAGQATRGTSSLASKEGRAPSPQERQSARPRSDGAISAAEGSAAEGVSALQGVYALQLSAFQDRLEAEQFIRKLQSGGLKPRIVATQIPGRGMWYRVRIGNFTSWDEAVRAKEAFERDHDLVAYVARQAGP